MKVIIDTNIYLNFYRLDSGQSLEMLKNLINFIESNKFELILPKQIEDEFIRNKNSKDIYSNHILNFEKGLDVTLRTPYLLNFSQKIDQIKKTVRKLNSLKADAVKDYKNRVFNPKSKINRSLNKLFSFAIRSTESDILLERAYFRTLRCNPPRKNNSSFGDAIIWETIVEKYVDDDFVLISGDGDFESEINPGKINELLDKEWSQKSSKKIILYKELGSFINEYSKDKKNPPIKKETIVDESVLNSTLVGSYIPSRVGVSDVVLGGGVVNLEDSIYNFKTPDTLYGLGVKNHCGCCGARIDSLSLGNDVMLGGNKCENCKDLYTVGQTCGKCGRHFHRGILSSSVSLFNSAYCDECQTKFINI